MGSVCSALHVPYMTTGTESSGEYVVRMGPMQEEVIQAVVDLVTEMKWTEVALVAHRQSGNNKTQKKIRLHGSGLSSFCSLFTVFWKRAKSVAIA